MTAASARRAEIRKTLRDGDAGRIELEPGEARQLEHEYLRLDPRRRKPVCAILGCKHPMEDE
jgi:hypothetical protein